MMETRNLVGMILAVTVGLICIGTVMMPILSDAMATEDTFVNQGPFYYGIFEPTDTYTLEFDMSTGTIEVDGTAVTPIEGISSTSYGSYSVIATEEMLFRFGSNISGYYMQIVGLDSNDSTIVWGGTEGLATISDGVLAVSYVSSGTTTNKTFEFTEMYAIVPTEDEAILKASSSEVYIKGDSPLYASGLTTITSWYNMFHFEGTYDDGITITSPNVSDVTFDNIEWNIEAVDGYEDLYKLTSVEFDIIYNEETTHATYSYFAVPTEVTAERSAHFDSTQIAVLSILPILLIIAVLYIAVRGLTRYD